MADLRVEHRVEFYLLACGYNGAMAVDTWRKLMDVLEIPALAQERVLRLAVRAICIGLCHLGWRTLLKCNKTNHACLYRLFYYGGY
jgi:hypothetical protein